VEGRLADMVLNIEHDDTLLYYRAADKACATRLTS